MQSCRVEFHLVFPSHTAMKVFAILFLAALASAELDWSDVRSVTDMEGFWAGRDPELVRMYLASKVRRNGRIVNGDIAAPHQFPYQVS